MYGVVCIGKDYFARIAMNDGRVYEGETNRDLNKIAWLRLLPITIELRNPYFWSSGMGGSSEYLRKTEEVFEYYKQGLERDFERSVTPFEPRSIKVIPQAINAVIFCEEVSKLEEKLQKE